MPAGVSAARSGSSAKLHGHVSRIGRFDLGAQSKVWAEEHLRPFDFRAAAVSPPEW